MGTTSHIKPDCAYTVSFGFNYCVPEDKDKYSLAYSFHHPCFEIRKDNVTTRYLGVG
jgi:hypothetical protein